MALGLLIAGLALLAGSLVSTALPKRRDPVLDPRTEMLDRAGRMTIRFSIWPIDGLVENEYLRDGEMMHALRPGQVSQFPDCRPTTVP